MRTLGITVGDPCGIGPEIVIKALRARPEMTDRCVLFGNLAMLRRAAAQLDCPLTFRAIASPDELLPGVVNVVDGTALPESALIVGRVCREGGACAWRAVEDAIDWALAGSIGAVTTAPLNKEALHLAGCPWPGHTEIFAARCAAPGSPSAMLLWSDGLKTIHVSTHVSLRQACDAVTRQRVEDVILLADDVLRRTGCARPHIAVAGLNPHAGEHGLFGDEELKEIVPAVRNCTARGVWVEGPVPPDTVFLSAARGRYDIVVAMYHDQGHIPLKMLAFDKGVNITVGLNVVRTSVDHGTAFDIAGKGIASEESMLKAMELGELLAARKGA